MQTTMYDILLQLPLFQGLCKKDFTSIIEKVKFHFHKYPDNEKIIRQGETCSKLIFLLNGEIILQSIDTNHIYTLTETIKAPFVIEPYSLFGMQTYYHATYKAKGPADIVSIRKDYIMNELYGYDIFQLNYLNILSNRAQSCCDKLWNIHIGNTKEKIINFILVRSIRNDGEKILKIRMQDFAKLINDTRINVSRTLNEMQDEGLIQLGRKEIIIPDFEKLLVINK